MTLRRNIPLVVFLFSLALGTIYLALFAQSPAPNPFVRWYYLISNPNERTDSSIKRTMFRWICCGEEVWTIEIGPNEDFTSINAYGYNGQMSGIYFHPVNMTLGDVIGWYGAPKNATFYYRYREYIWDGLRAWTFNRQKTFGVLNSNRMIVGGRWDLNTRLDTVAIYRPL